MSFVSIGVYCINWQGEIFILKQETLAIYKRTVDVIVYAHSKENALGFTLLFMVCITSPPVTGISIAEENKIDNFVTCNQCQIACATK